MFKKIIGLWFPSKGKNATDVALHIKWLVESGAGEFFTGYNPPYWYEKFGFEVSPNGRFAEHEQITDFDTLKQVVAEVHTYGLEIFWNLNFRYYTDETMPFIEKMVQEFIEVGLDGVICGNIGILEYLKKIGFKGKINISTILAVYNNEAIKFLLENYKINKVILSREVTLKEIEEILKEFPDVLFEVFGEGDFCRYNNGLCYAEHKYTSRDICTLVVNDLVIKKRYNPDFKKIILNPSITALEKVKMFQDQYEDIFQQIENLLEGLIIGEWEKKEVLEKILKIVTWAQSRVDLFFDGLKPMTDKKNKDVISFLKWLKFLIAWIENKEIDIKSDLLKNIQALSQEIEKSIKSGLWFLKRQVQDMWWDGKLKAYELKNFYAKGDALNLYAYLFFSKFKNLETVKFPTRGRNYAEKIALIEKVLQEGSVSGDLIDRRISPERTHYDLTYLFADKLWFRKMLQNMK